MALKQFYGFDNFGGEVVGGAQGTSLIFPKPGAGIVGTPYEKDLVITYGNVSGAYGTSNTAGVTGLEAHKIGQGAERRNLCVLARESFTSGSYLATMRVQPQRDMVANIAYGFYRVTGFTYVDLSATPPPAAYNLVSHRRATSTSGIITRNATGLVFYNQNRPCVLGQPYYIEIVEKMLPTSNTSTSGLVKMELWCDGELIIEFDFTTLPYNGIYASNLEVSGGGSNQAHRTMVGLADMYTCDDVGEAPFNGRLGPQVVLPFPVTAVQQSNWILEGAADPLAALTDRSDTTYLRSPKASSEIILDADLGLKVGAQVNGLQFFGRVRRDAAAQRSLTGRVERDGGVSMGAPTINSAPANFTDVMMGKVLPATPAERLLLDFPNTGKIQVKVRAD